jgi:hypothetical protein
MTPIATELIYGLIGTFLFLFKNPHPKHKYPIALSVLGLFISHALYVYFDNILPAQITWALSALGVLSFYALRFKDKPSKGIIDFLKLIALILLIIYPHPFYSIVPFGDGLFWTIINTLTFYLLVSIYIYDRLILKPETMKKKFIITLVIQTVLFGLFFIYAFVQKLEADYQKEKSFEAQEVAVATQKEAEQDRKILEVKLANLTEQLDKLKEEVKNCH